MPGSGGLLESVEGLVQLAGQVWVIVVVARWLLDVHILVQLAVEECSLDVELVNFQVQVSSDG